MKYLIIPIVALLMACAEQQVSEPIQGKPVGGQVPAYAEMCEREPESPLCVNELQQTDSNLNAQWCRLCLQDPTLSYCKFLNKGECNDFEVRVPTPEPKLEIPEVSPADSSAIQGNKVRLNAKAFHEMCTREYNPLLCPDKYKKED